MVRYRTIVASPLRSATATWQVITDLVVNTIAKSPSLSRDDAECAMSVAAPVGRMLIAGGYLDRYPVTLIVGTVHCEITTISGTAALNAEENLNAIPGAAAASTYTIHLPTPDPLHAAVAAAVSGHDRLSDAKPPLARTHTASASQLIDTDALRKEVAKP